MGGNDLFSEDEVHENRVRGPKGGPSKLVEGGALEAPFIYLDHRIPSALFVSGIDHDAVEAECELATAANTSPSTLEEIEILFNRAAMFFPDFGPAYSQRTYMVAEWLRLMGEIPGDLLEKALDLHLQEGEPRFPLPADLLRSARPALDRRRRRIKSASEYRQLKASNKQAA